MRFRSHAPLPASTAAATLAAAALTLPLTAPAEAGLVAHFPFDDTSDVTNAVETVFGNDAQTVTPGAPGNYNTGLLGSAYEFGGISGRALRSDAGQLIDNYPFSVSMFVNYASGTNRVAASLTNGSFGEFYTLGSSGGNAVAGARNGGSTAATSATATNDSTWHHIVGVYSESQRLIYVDGVLTGTDSTSVPFIDDPDENGDPTRFSLGAVDRSNVVDVFAGLVDDTGLSDEALNPAQIAAINGLARLSGANLAENNLDAIIAAFENQTGTVTVLGDEYTFGSGLTGGLGTVGGSSADASGFIVLDGAGNGLVQVVPEPGSFALLTLAGAALLRRRDA